MNPTKVHGPRPEVLSKDITIQWSMGNSCNFECEYCPTQLHDGSLGWHDTNKYVDIIEKICKHYQEQDKVVNFEFIGGEVTVIPGFIEILEKVKEYNGHNIIFTNGSRTVNWWSKAKHLIDDLVISYHPQSMDEDSLIEIAEEIKDSVYTSYQLAGVKDYLPRLELLAERPLSSADSTNAERNGLFDNVYAPPTRGQRSSVIAWRVEQHQSAGHWVPDPQMELELSI